MKVRTWGAMGLIVLVGCSSTATDSADSTASTATGQTVEVAAVPPPSSATPATVATTIPAPTQPVDPCAGFEALLGYERMMAVKDGTAPTEDACRAAVDRSRLALNTYEVGLVFSEAYDNVDNDDIVDFEYCDQATFTNPFDVPVIYWGVTYVETADDTVVSYRPYTTEVIQPGGSAPVPIPGPTDPDLFCSLSFEGIVAPVGGLAAGIDGAPAPADDPLNSDDPQVWGLALLDHGDDNVPMDEMVNRVEDIHSNDVGNHLRSLTAPADEPTDDAGDQPQETPTRTICGAEPADLGPDVAGEYAWLIYDSRVSDRSWRQIGLFSRGVDRRWRFVGTVRLIDETDAATEPCDVPPLT